MRRTCTCATWKSRCIGLPLLLVQPLKAPSRSSPRSTASAKGLTYQSVSPSYGSLASGRSALSADGREVVFVTTAISDLLPAEPPALPETPETPALQVAVRDLDTQSTQLVSVAYDPTTGAPAVDPETGATRTGVAAEGGNVYGAVYNPGNTPPAFPFTSRAYRTDDPGRGFDQRRRLDGRLDGPGHRPSRRRYSPKKPCPRATPSRCGGASTPGLKRRTRRVTGGSDPANPACVASGETVLPEQPSLVGPLPGPVRPVEHRQSRDLVGRDG